MIKYLALGIAMLSAIGEIVVMALGASLDRFDAVSWPSLALTWMIIAGILIWESEMRR
jgi:hypothetical protein